MAPWTLYVLISEDRARTYVGITKDLGKRLEQHNGERPGGAKATRVGRPWSVGATFGPFETRALAQAAEHRLKRRSGRQRLRPNALDDDAR
ncbi:MAG: GIY-YIG nuclease family protein [Myxococcales bacterium]|nr:GIY-YIG nuclease family protein [Myxococcales bacterium]